jgi:mRNA interferase MazF
MSTAPTPAPRRGEIWLVDFDPAIGAEIRKLRPALVINVDAIGRLSLRLVVPVTDWKPQYVSYPWFVIISASLINGLVKDSGADGFQVKSLSLRRFDRRIGEVTGQQSDDVASAIALCVGAP